jgi:hypothetical protein
MNKLFEKWDPYDAQTRVNGVVGLVCPECGEHKAMQHFRRWIATTHHLHKVCNQCDPPPKRSELDASQVRAVVAVANDSPNTPIKGRRIDAWNAELDRRREVNARNGRTNITRMHYKNRADSVRAIKGRVSAEMRYVRMWLAKKRGDVDNMSTTKYQHPTEALTNFHRAYFPVLMRVRGALDRYVREKAPLEDTLVLQAEREMLEPLWWHAVQDGLPHRYKTPALLRKKGE